MRVNIDTVYRRDGNEVTVRKRDTSLTIRLTPSEKELIFLRAKQKHLCVTDYIVATLLFDDQKKNSFVRPLMIKIKCVTDQLSTIQKELKETSFYYPDFNEVADLQREIIDMLTQIACMQK